MKYPIFIFILFSSFLQISLIEYDTFIDLEEWAVSDSTFCDVEGNIYVYRKIGKQYWMVDNFKSSKSVDGREIQGIYLYKNDTSNLQDYGRLYTWSAAVEATPKGWRLPTSDDWVELINSFGNSNSAGGSLKESGTVHWIHPNKGATNSSGFRALPGGFRGPDSNYYELGKHGDYWGTANDGKEPFCVYFYNTLEQVITEISPTDKTSGIAFSVRYVKD